MREDLLSQRHLKMARAFRLKLTLQELYAQPDWRHAEDHVGRCYLGTMRSRLEPMRRLACTIRDPGDGIVRWYETGRSTGRMEGLNSLVQAAKAWAREYRATRNLIMIIYLLGTKLNYGLPKLSTYFRDGRGQTCQDVCQGDRNGSVVVHLLFLTYKGVVQAPSTASPIRSDQMTLAKCVVDAMSTEVGGSSAWPDEAD